MTSVTNLMREIDDTDLANVVVTITFMPGDGGSRYASNGVEYVKSTVTPLVLSSIIDGKTTTSWTQNLKPNTDFPTGDTYYHVVERMGDTTLGVYDIVVPASGTYPISQILATTPVGNPSSAIGYKGLSVADLQAYLGSPSAARKYFKLYVKADGSGFLLSGDAESNRIFAVAKGAVTSYSKANRYDPAVVSTTFPVVAAEIVSIIDYTYEPATGYHYTDNTYAVVIARGADANGIPIVTDKTKVFNLTRTAGIFSALPADTADYTFAKQSDADGDYQLDIHVVNAGWYFVSVIATPN